MTPFKTKVAAATGPRWVHLLVVLVPAMLAAPAGAQLQEALTAQVAADKAAADAQKAIARKTPPAAMRRPWPMPTAWSATTVSWTTR